MQMTLPETVEECLKAFGKYHSKFQISKKSDAEILELQEEFAITAKSNGFPNLIWKRDENKLYAF